MTMEARSKRSRSESGNDVQQAIGRIRSTLLTKATSVLEDDINNNHQTNTQGRKKQRRTPGIAAQDFVERDGIKTRDSQYSVGTIIKRESLRLYHSYKKLKGKEKGVVALGANSILDLTSEEDSVHRYLFSDEGWAHLKSRYGYQYEDPVTILDDNNQAIRDIEKVSKQDLGKARSIANKNERAHKDGASTMFDLISEYLKVLQYRKKVFRNDIDITENDLCVKVWGPLLECIMRDEQDLRLKWGDSVGDSAEAANGHDAFKVDVRVVRDIFSARQSKKESDAGNAELSRKDASVGKITDDKVKLLIESKCVLDRIISTLEIERPVVVPALQLKGLRAKLFSVRLVADGLYVAVNEGSCTLPSTAADIYNLRQVYILLEKFKNASVDLSNLALYSISSPAIPERTRKTWIPPRSNRITPLPKYLLDPETHENSSSPLTS